MTIGPHDAALALDTVEEAATRAQRARGYRIASAPLMIWGVVWMVANGLCELFPDRPGTIWLVADSIGVAATIIVTMRAPPPGRETARMLGGLMAAMAVFVLAVLFVMPRAGGVQIDAFISLTGALLFMITGVATGLMRFAVLGATLTAAIAGGYLMLDAYHYLWFGVVGGAALFLAGLWMRKV